MSKNSKIIEQFYEAFQDLDSERMNTFMHDEVQFEDPAFGKIEGLKVKYLWQYLTQHAHDFEIEFSEIKTKGKFGSAHWEAHYTFAKTGFRVHNIIESTFEFKDGLIISYQDDFNIKNWVKQALGSSFGILGGSFLLKKIIRKKSNALLDKYMDEYELL